MGYHTKNPADTQPRLNFYRLWAILTPMNANAIKIAIIISAPRVINLAAGREELAPEAMKKLPDDDLPFFKVGLAEGDELHVSGPLIGDPQNLAGVLELAWYFPNEEEAEEARPIEVSQVTVSVQTLPRQRAGAGERWRYRLESSRPYRAVMFFEGSFMPPFKAAEVQLHIDHLINYNYDGYVLSGLSHNYRPPSYVEMDWQVPVIESEGYLED